MTDGVQQYLTGDVRMVGGWLSPMSQSSAIVVGTAVKPVSENWRPVCDITHLRWPGQGLTPWLSCALDEKLLS